MSASDKKKLRKEQAAATVTEKQRTEKKEQKKLKAYTVTFIIAMVLVVAIFVGTVLQAPVATLLMKSTTAVTIGEHKVDSVQFNYFFMDSISQFTNQFSSYGDYASMMMQMYTGYNPTLSLSSQVYNKTTGETWADYFTDSAIANAKWNYAMYDKAMAEGFTLSEQDKAYLEQTEQYLDLYAAFSGATSAEAYLRAIYGNTASVKSYMEYTELTTIAQAYAAKYVDSLKFDDADFRAHETEKYHEYNSFSWLYYQVKVNDYLKGGTTTKDENGKETTTYSDEEKAAALAAAKADAEALVASKATNKEELEKAINALEINKPDPEAKDPKLKEATESKNVLYSNISLGEESQKWLSSSDRKAGDLTSIEISTGEGDNKTVNGFYILLWTGKTENKIPVGTVRHLLVAFEEDKDGKVSDEAKAKAKKEAEDLLAEYKSGEQTEEAFTALLKKHSDDKDSSTGAVNNDGLYESITPDSNYVQEFKDFANAEHKPGDTEIIETEFGYHIMYYVETAELNYRDAMINNVLITEAYEKWETAILEATKVTEGNMKYVNEDYIMTVKTA